MSNIDNQSSDGNTTKTEEGDVKNSSERTFTQEDLGKQLSLERNKLREQFEKEKQDALNLAKSEWERQAKLTEEERATEAQKTKEEAIAKREREVTLRERRVEAITLLTEKNLPATFVEFVLDENAEQMTSKINALAKTWSDELKKTVKDVVSGATPEDKSKDVLIKNATTASNIYKGNGSSVI